MYNKQNANFCYCYFYLYYSGEPHKQESFIYNRLEYKRGKSFLFPSKRQTLINPLVQLRPLQSPAGRIRTYTWMRVAHTPKHTTYLHCSTVHRTCNINIRDSLASPNGCREVCDFRHHFSRFLICGAQAFMFATLDS